MSATFFVGHVVTSDVNSEGPVLLIGDKTETTVVASECHVKGPLTVNDGEETFMLPSNRGAENQYMQTNGQGQAVWTSVSPGNPFDQELNTDSNVQFSDTNVTGALKLNGFAGFPGQPIVSNGTTCEFGTISRIASPNQTSHISCVDNYQIFISAQPPDVVSEVSAAAGVPLANIGLSEGNIQITSDTLVLNGYTMPNLGTGQPGNSMVLTDTGVVFQNLAGVSAPDGSASLVCTDGQQLLLSTQIPPSPIGVFAPAPDYTCSLDLNNGGVTLTGGQIILRALPAPAPLSAFALPETTAVFIDETSAQISTRTLDLSGKDGINLRSEFGKINMYDVYNMPSTLGSANQVLSCKGTGDLAWAYSSSFTQSFGGTASNGQFFAVNGLATTPGISGFYEDIGVKFVVPVECIFTRISCNWTCSAEIDIIVQYNSNEDNVPFLLFSGTNAIDIFPIDTPLTAGSAVSIKRVSGGPPVDLTAIFTCIFQ